MKILYISSGHSGIYEWFDNWIKIELGKKHEIQFYQSNQGLPTLQVLTEQYQPDLALTLIGYSLQTPMLDLLKQKGVKTAVWLTEDPYFMDRTLLLLDHYDYVFTIDTAALQLYQKMGHKQSFHLPLGTNEEVFKPKIAEKKYQSDICFVGYPYPERVKYIQLLLQHTPYKIIVVGNWRHLLRGFRRNPNLVIYEGWIAPPIVVNIYNGAKIVLNTHRPFNLNHNQNKLGIVGKSINNRTFDVASCAAFQLIEFKEDLPLHFIENEEIISYTTLEQLFEKIHYYVHADEERETIAHKARKRVLNEHTFQHRLEKMISIIEGSSV